jgi:hypothetical protein
VKLLRRAFGLVAAPGETWRAIAAEGDTGRWLFRLYLPVLAVVPLLLQAAVGVRQGFGLTSAESVTSGTTSTVTSLTPSLAALAAMPFSIGFALLSAALLRDMTLQTAMRHGAVADPVAATKLAAYGQTGFWLAAATALIPEVGGLAWLAGLIFGFLLLRRGAPLLLPPRPGQERALGRAVMLRACQASLLAGIATAVATAIAFAVLAAALLRFLAPILPGAQETIAT